MPKVYHLPFEREKRKTPKIVKFFIVLIFVLGGLSYLFFFTPVFQIKNIMVENSLMASQLESLKGQNIFLVNTAKIKQDIIALQPEITDFKIIRGLPDTLRIQFSSKAPEIIWKTQDKSYLVEATGKIFAENQDEKELPVVQDSRDLAVSLGQQIVTNNFINFIRNSGAKFSEKFGFKIVYFEVNETIFQVEALTDQGWKVKFDTTRSIDDQLDGLSKLLSEHKDEVSEYVDVRVEGKVYYK